MHSAFRLPRLATAGMRSRIRQLPISASRHGGASWRECLGRAGLEQKSAIQCSSIWAVSLDSEAEMLE